MLSVWIVQLDAELALPAYAHPGDAGLDLRARVDAIIAPAGGRALIPTGIAIAIPEGYAGFVLPRSGLALKHGIGLANTPGLIDSAYRGEIKVVLLNTANVIVGDYDLTTGGLAASIVEPRAVFRKEIGRAHV